uniref:Uncharacterized protein n=1 Tax=Anguilla anguilla TaxID=7936 RepID=A0A0E9P6F7_ANGAN
MNHGLCFNKISTYCRNLVVCKIKLVVPEFRSITIY